MISPWIKPKVGILTPTSNHQTQAVCMPSDSPEKQQASVTSSPADSSPTDESQQAAVTYPLSTESVTSSTTTSTATVVDSLTIKNSTLSASSTITDPLNSSTTSSTGEYSSAIPSNVTSDYSSASSITAKAQSSMTTPKDKTVASTLSSSMPLPTIQESFFEAVSRRLQLLEANSTLSLKYIEEQSKILREAFTKVEKKQLQKTGVFLDTLNSTVLDELRGFRQQYDEIWQSTVISLESQREESHREILAISTRLNILADEVVFQKRMSIIQSVLLLLCLGLVIFSRVPTAGHIDFTSMQARARSLGFPISPVERSPTRTEYHGRVMDDGGQWLASGHRLQRSDTSQISQSRSRDEDTYINDSPPTPVSPYSRSDGSLTPLSGGDDIVETTPPRTNTGEYLKPPAHASHSHADSRITQVIDYDGPHSSEVGSEPSKVTRGPKERKAFMRQQSSPPPSGEDMDLVEDGSPEYQYPGYDSGTFGSASPEPEGRVSDWEQRLPSPPLEKNVTDKNDLRIARKPLPALPMDGN
jgi:hypothetical protein